MNIDEARKRINSIDGEIVRLLEERYECIEQIARSKAESGMPVFDRSREEEVLNRVNESVKNRSYAEPIVDTFCAIMESSRQYQTTFLENIVLIGMPGCGKSSIGRRFAEAYGYTFIDADEEFARINGITPEEYINKYGEAEFRKKETTVLEGFRPNRRAVYALGGGVVTVADNFELVKPLGTVIYIKRELSALPQDGRPISQNKGIERLFAERAQLYELWADTAIENVSVDDAVLKISAIFGREN